VTCDRKIIGESGDVPQSDSQAIGRDQAGGAHTASRVPDPICCADWPDCECPNRPRSGGACPTCGEMGHTFCWW
jgi:hypothetical protein